MSSRIRQIPRGVSSACYGSSMLETRNTIRSTAYTTRLYHACSFPFIHQSEPTGCFAPNWRSLARSSIYKSGLQTVHAVTHVASIEPHSGVGSIRFAQSNCGRPRDRLHRELYALAVSADLSEAQLRHCKSALRRFWIKAGNQRGTLTNLGRTLSPDWTLNQKPSRAVGFFHSAKPCLSPIGVNLAWTKPTAGRSLARTNDTIEDEAVLANIEHATCLVVDNSLHPVLNAESPPAIGKHFAVEVKSATKAARV